MMSQTNTKVRFVRCPKCRLILPELAEIPLYKCGGCGTVLQAKNRKSNTSDTGLNVHENDSKRKGEEDHGSVGQVISSFSPGPIIASGESSTEESRGHQVNNGIEHPKDGDLPDLPPCLPVLVHVNDKVPLEDGQPTGQCEDSSTLDQSPGSQNSSKEFSGHSYSSDELYSSTERTCHLKSKSAAESIENMDHEAVKSMLDQIVGKEHYGCGDCKGMQPDAIDDSNYASSPVEVHPLKNELSPEGGIKMEDEERGNIFQENNEMGQQLRGLCKTFPESYSSDITSIPEYSCQNTEELPTEATYGEPTENSKTCLVGGSSGAAEIPHQEPNESAIGPQSPLNETILANKDTSPDSAQLDKSQERISELFHRASSTDTLENLQIVNSSSELGLMKRRDMSRSPTSKSYYGYDGSVSSYDGTDDQIPDHVTPLSQTELKEADFVNTTRLPTDNEYRVNDMQNSGSGMKYHVKKPSAALHRKDHHATEGISWLQDKMLQPSKHDLRNGIGVRLEKGEGVSRSTFTSTSSEARQRNESTSSHKPHNKFQRNTGFYSSNEPSYNEPDKMELLRMVCELKDQLRRTKISQEMATRRFPTQSGLEGRHESLFYDQSVLERETFPDIISPRHPGVYGNLVGRPQQCRVSRVPFSGEAAHFRHQVDCSCSHCCPQDWRRSAQLPTHSICCNQVHCVAHPGHGGHNFLPSSFSSPQHYTNSEFSIWGRETKSDHHRQKDHEMKKLLLREKYQSSKRHLRPKAGGAPIIACYNCSELLHLPADFLLFKRRCHHLRCTSCGGILKFSVQNRIHLLPYAPDSVAPPPSEVDDYYNDTITRGLPSTAHSNYCQHAEPVSCSDDYGPSFCRSCSTEGEPSFLTPKVQPFESKTYNRKMSSGSSFEPTEDRKMKSISTDYPNINRKSVQTGVSAGPSWTSRRFKPSSEIEELPQSTGSPLHRLMGYSSPREMIYN